MPVKGKKKRATVRTPRRKAGAGAKRPGLNLQDVILRLSEFWGKHGCVLTPAYDVEVGAGTMCPETFLRALGPNPYRGAYVQPSRRPADGRYGENPNRLLKHLQYQVILKPPPRDVQDSYLKSLEVLGINLQDHDIRFEEDNWESPTLGAWGVGWQVMLDGRGNYAIHLFSTVWRDRPGAHFGGVDLWVGAHLRLPPGRFKCL